MNQLLCVHWSWMRDGKCRSPLSWSFNHCSQNLARAAEEGLARILGEGIWNGRSWQIPTTSAVKPWSPGCFRSFLTPVLSHAGESAPPLHTQHLHGPPLASSPAYWLRWIFFPCANTFLSSSDSWLSVEHLSGWQSSWLMSMSWTCIFKKEEKKKSSPRLWQMISPPLPTRNVPVLNSTSSGPM